MKTGSKWKEFKLMIKDPVLHPHLHNFRPYLRKMATHLHDLHPHLRNFAPFMHNLALLSPAPAAPNSTGN